MDDGWMDGWMTDGKGIVGVGPLILKLLRDGSSFLAKGGNEREAPLPPLWRVSLSLSHLCTPPSKKQPAHNRPAPALVLH